MTTIIIFDLDDTLVNCKMKISRQTYHMLNKFKKLNYIMGIITYNKMVGIVAKETNLYKYTNYIICENISRDLLFEKCLSQIIDENKINIINQIYYIDDRLDNIQIIKEKHKKINTYHCDNLYNLYKFKYTI